MGNTTAVHAEDPEPTATEPAGGGSEATTTSSDSAVETGTEPGGSDGSAPALQPMTEAQTETQVLPKLVTEVSAPGDGDDGDGDDAPTKPGQEVSGEWPFGSKKDPKKDQSVPTSDKKLAGEIINKTGDSFIDSANKIGAATGSQEKVEPNFVHKALKWLLGK